MYKGESRSFDAYNLVGMARMVMSCQEQTSIRNFPKRQLSKHKVLVEPEEVTVADPMT